MAVKAVEVSKLTQQMMGWERGDAPNPMDVFSKLKDEEQAIRAKMKVASVDLDRTRAEFDQAKEAYDAARQRVDAVFDEMTELAWRLRDCQNRAEQTGHYEGFEERHRHKLQPKS